MAKYKISHKDFMNRLASIISGSTLDSGEGLIIPHLKVAIVVEDWGPNYSDRFSMFHHSESGLDYLLQNVFIPADNPHPVDYVAAFCMSTLIEKYYGRYIDDIENPSKCMNYWNEMMADDNAEYYFKPRCR